MAHFTVQKTPEDAAEEEARVAREKAAAEAAARLQERPAQFWDSLLKLQHDEAEAAAEARALVSPPFRPHPFFLLFLAECGWIRRCVCAIAKAVDCALALSGGDVV